jgi:hypothetical protein
MSSVVDVTHTPSSDLARTLAAFPQGVTAVLQDVNHLNEIVLCNVARDIINDIYACTVVIGQDVITKEIATRLSGNISNIHRKRLWAADRAAQIGATHAASNPDILCPMCGMVGNHQIPRRHPVTQVMGIQWTCIRGMDGWWEEPSKRAVRSLINEEKRRVNQRTQKVMKDINKNSRKGVSTTYIMNAYERAARGKLLMRNLDLAAKRKKEKKKTKEEKAAEKQRLAEEREWRAIERGQKIASRKLDDSGVTMVDNLPMSDGIKLKIKCGETVQEKFIERKMLMPPSSRECEPGKGCPSGGLGDVHHPPCHTLRARDGTTYKLRAKPGGGRKNADRDDQANDKDGATNVTHARIGVKV